MTYTFTNINDAFPALATAVLAGEEVGSRNGRTRELVHAHVKLTDPTAREILLPSRRANLAAQIAETVWVLAGRNDIGWLSRYLPRARDFSDDGETWRGGYGPRIRAWRGHTDQLAAVVDLLRADPATRRAVIQIYDPSVDGDLNSDSRDIPCLAGDTPIWSPEGDLPIAEVAGKFASGEVTRWPVYSVDPDTQAMNLRWASKVWCSGVKKTIKLSFDDGSSIRLTSDHRLYRKQYRGRHGVEVSEVLAGDLQPGDRVLATHRMYEPKGYESHKKSLKRNTAYSNQRKTHRAYAELLWGPIPEGHDVHHKDEVKTNNQASNLEVLPHGAHSSLNMFGDRNPMRRLTPSQHADRAKKQSDSIKAWWDTQSEERRKAQADLMHAGRYGEKPDNHVVVSVEEGYEEPVYDFTVPEDHTALVGTGVVAHNCNLNIHFLSRLGYLHAQVTVRSNDLWWGWSGINAFEWSALLEIVAGLTGMKVGHLTFATSSLHLYDRHWDRAEKLVAAPPSSALYAPGPSPRFAGGRNARIEDLDETLRRWFEVEEKIRTNRPGFEEDVASFREPMLRSWLRVLAWYWTGDVEHLSTLRGTRLYAAAEVSYRPEPEPASALESTPSSFLRHVQDLHAAKHAAYGDSWKRRGELLGILANVARKVDRLGIDGAGETAADTAVDLTVYLAKYRLWLTETESVFSPIQSRWDHPSDLVEPVNQLLDRLAGNTPTRSSVAVLEQHLADDFAELEKMPPADERVVIVDHMLPLAYELASKLWWAESNATRRWKGYEG